MENAIDSRTRIKTTTYRGLRQKPCQFYWHGLLQITIVVLHKCSCHPVIFRNREPATANEIEIARCPRLVPVGVSSKEFSSRAALKAVWLWERRLRVMYSSAQRKGEVVLRKRRLRAERVFNEILGALYFLTITAALDQFSCDRAYILYPSVGYYLSPKRSVSDRESRECTHTVQQARNSS